MVFCLSYSLSVGLLSGVYFSLSLSSLSVGRLSFFLVLHDALRRGWLPPGKRAWGKPTSDRHPHALKGIGCGPASITSASGTALFAFPRGRSCGPHFRAGGHPSPRSRPVAPDTSSHTAPSARALRHVTGDKCSKRRISDLRRWDTPDPFPRRDLEKSPRSGMSAQEVNKILKVPCK